MKVEGNIVDIHNKKIFPGEICIENNRIISITENQKTYSTYILPGFIDGHVHIESSMLTPSEFSKLVIKKGTIAVINDPHEIANVLGKRGIEFMLENSREASIYCYFGIPSCVPATPFDYSGGIICANDVEELAKTGNFIALSEVMNIPGILQKDEDLIHKIEIAKKYNLKIDGHAPLLKGENLNQYIKSGIDTDHECTSLEEGIEKIKAGMKILIREGSTAQNYSALKDLIKLYPDKVMFCTDDSHPDDIIHKGHIDKIVKKALEDGFDLFNTLKIACLNPIRHYSLDIGTIRIGDKADFIRVNNLQDFKVEEVFINGKINYNQEKNQTISSPLLHYPNSFRKDYIASSQLICAPDKRLECIGIIPNELVTEKRTFDISKSVNFESDISQDILKIVYLNRYTESLPQIGYICGFGLHHGAFGTCIAHDSHNILAVGTRDEDIIAVVNTIIQNKGSLAIKKKNQIYTLPLPIGGIMSDKNGYEVTEEYEKMNQLLKEMGCKIESPFMTLSFMSLLVIPEIKIGEKGIFNYSKMEFIENE